MPRKKRKNRNYDICGVVEVINITKGRRKTTILNLDAEITVENIEISGSIVTKTPIYQVDATQTTDKEEVSGE
jgi:hypothetical protein